MGSLPLLSHAGPQFINRLTDLVNSILTDGVALESLLTGKMTLIDKKSPSLLVTNKRPLTVSSAIFSDVTKLIHSRMDPIC